MWIWVVFCVLPAVYAASKVGPHYGSLASWATLVGVLATQTALLMWVVDRVTRRLGLAGQADATAPSDSLDDEPVDGPDDTPDVPLRYGAHARFKQLVLTADVERSEVTRRFYDKAKQAIEAYVDVETGRDGSGAAMVSADDLAAADGLPAAPPDETLTVFVSNDGAWSGFRVGDDSFRFRHGAITRLRLTHVMPVRWSGDYMVTFWFDVPKREHRTDYDAYSTGFDLGVNRASRHSRSLNQAFRQIASVLDVPFDIDETGDD